MTVASPDTPSSTKLTPGGNRPFVPVSSFSLSIRRRHIIFCRRTLLTDNLGYRVQCGWLARLASCSDFLVWEVRSRSPRLPQSPPSVFTSHMVHVFLSHIPLYHLLISCPQGIPIALRVIHSKHFVRGPFHLGVMSFPVSITAVIWIAFISIVFILPELNPVDSQTLNYAIVAVGIVITYSMGFWVLSARKWFTGPVKQIEGTCQ